MSAWDAIVVGSGPGGVSAAVPLVEAGLRVLMLDFGRVDRRYAGLIAPRPFRELRRSDPRQHRYLLGDDFEGIPRGAIGLGAQLTPPRAHAVTGSDRHLTVVSKSFAAALSLARGGLGAAWSAGAFRFSAAELKALGLDPEILERHYRRVAARIGIAGGGDDLDRIFPPLPGQLPALRPDSGAAAVLRRYQRRRSVLARRGFHLGATPLAVCSVEHRGRGPHRALDLEYWADVDRSIYRPQWTLEELQRAPGFRYRDRRWVERFVEREDGVEVTALNVDGEETEVHRGRALVLAAGALGSARLALRSLECWDHPVPLVSNPYTHVAMLNRRVPGGMGEPAHGLAQLTAVLEPDGAGDSVQAQLFSYRSLPGSRVLAASPLGARDTLRLLRLLQPRLALLGIHHADRPSASKRCLLRRGADGGPDRLEIDYSPSGDEVLCRRLAERRLLACFRRLGCLPFRRVDPGAGAGLHYAGTLPLSADDRELTCEPEGRLRGTRRVWIADGSALPWLPAKGLTFTLMANADRVGGLLARELVGDPAALR